MYLEDALQRVRGWNEQGPQAGLSQFLLGTLEADENQVRRQGHDQLEVKGE